MMEPKFNPRLSLTIIKNTNKYLPVYFPTIQMLPRLTSLISINMEF